MEIAIAGIPKTMAAPRQPNEAMISAPTAAPTTAPTFPPAMCALIARSVVGAISMAPVLLLITRGALLAVLPGLLLLISPLRVHVAVLLSALQPLVDAIDVRMMREAIIRSSGDRNASPGEAARWLWNEIQKKR